MPSYNKDSISTGLNTRLIGNKIHFFETLPSTNEKLYKLALSGAKEGSVVIADSQSAGKGRLGRRWFSPEGKNIYTSALVRPDMPASEAPRLTLVCAVALHETIAGFISNNIEFGIKWPNDLLTRSRKCAGILTEMKNKRQAVDFVVVGIGINVNLKQSDIPADLRHIATSLQIETGKESSREAIIQKLYFNIEKWYKEYLQNGFAPIAKAWNNYSIINGKQIKTSASSSVDAQKGIAMGVNNDGELLIDTGSAGIKTITCGEIDF